MKRNTLKHLQAMGIVLMTGITLGSIAPSANALKSIDGNLTAQASRVHHHHRKARHQRKHVKLSRARLHRIYAKAVTNTQRKHRNSLMRLRHKYASALRSNRAELARLNARISRDEAKAGQKHTKRTTNHNVENKLRAEVKANRALIMRVEKAHLIQSKRINNQLKNAMSSNRSLRGQIHQDHLVINQLRKMSHGKRAKKAPKAQSHRLNAVLASLAKNNQRINQLQKSVNTYKTANVAQGKQLSNVKRALARAERQKASVQKRVVVVHKNYRHNQNKLNNLNRNINAKITSAINKATANQRSYDSGMIKNVSRKYESQLSSSNATNRALIRELRDSHAKDKAKLVEAIHQEDIAQQRVQAFIQASNKKAKQNAKASKTNTNTVANNNSNNNATTNGSSYTYTDTSSSTGNTGDTPATMTVNTSNITSSGINSFDNNMMMAVNDNKKIKKYASHQSPKTKKAISKAVAHNNETNKIIKSGGQHVVHESVNQQALDDNVNYVINLGKKAQRSKNRKKAKEAKEKLDASILAGSWNSKKQRKQLEKMDKKNEANENKSISNDLNPRNGDIGSKKMRAKHDDYLIGLFGGRSALDKEKAQAIVSKEKNINIPKLIKKIKGNSKKAKRARKNLKNAEKSLKKKNVSLNKPKSKKSKKNKKNKKGKKKRESSKKPTESWVPRRYVKGKWHKGYRGKNGKWHKGYRSHGHYTGGYMKFNGSKSQVAKADAKSIMELNKDIAKLKSGRQTRATKLKIHEDTVAKNGLDQQMIKNLEDQMDKLIHQKDYDEQQLGYQKQEYSYHEPDANHVDHLMQGQLYWKNKIKVINKKINKLEAQIQKLGGMIYGNEANEKIDEFNAEIDGDLSKVQPLNRQIERYLQRHPQYVVVTTPTYYFDDYDISNPNSRDLAVQPGQPSNNPYHRVLNAYEVTLKSGRSFEMYRVTSNDDRDAYSYLIMANATQQETPPVKHYHVHSYRYDRKIYITHGEAYEYSALPSKHLHDHASIEGVMRMGYRDLQGHRARIVRAYYFNKSKKSPFAYELSDGKYVKANDVYVQSASHLHAAKFSDSDIDNWVNGSI